MSSKELEQLHKRRQRAQEQGDIVEEAKLCNAIGELHSENGDHRRGLKYHQQEISLSEAAGDQIGTAVAHRKVGECHCELGNYQDAIHHQEQHLRIARALSDLAEEQRALATLGRTYFVYSQSEEERGKQNATDLSLKAEKHYLGSLDVCDKLVSRIPDKELLEMRSRLYLNLGLVYESQSDLKSARQSMEKALNILKELGDSATIVQCYFDLGSLHLRDLRPSLALKCFQQTLDMAKELKNKKLEVDALREIAQAYLRLDDLQQAKSYLKKALLLNQPNGDRELVEKQLLTIRKILQYSSEVETTETEEIEKKLKLYEKLGDLCCGLKAYTTAIDFYGQQLDLAESHDKGSSQLSPIYISLARTHSDCGQFPQALTYYNKELESCCFKPIEKCDTWTSIARLHADAGHKSETVMEAYRKAAGFADESGHLKHQMDVYKSILKFCRSRDDLDTELSHWEVRLSQLLESHPQLAADDDGSSDEEDSQGLDYQELSDVPSSLPSEDSEDEEEEGTTYSSSVSMPTTQASRSVGVASSSSATIRQPPLTRSQSGVVVRKKAKLLKKNEKGETLLHVASIQGNLATVKKLIREGADVNARDNCGWVPLHEACNYGHLDVVEVLLESNANIDDPGGRDCNGITPLIDAANNGHVSVVKLLIERGADVLIKDQRGFTALDIVVGSLSSKAESGQSYDLEEEHKAICELLEREMRRRGHEPSPSASNGSLERGQRERRTSGQYAHRKLTRTQQASRGSSTRKEMSTSISQATKKNKPLLKGRFGSNLLYSSSEDEHDDMESSITALPQPLSAHQGSSTQPATHRHRTSTDGASNPFETFTVGRKNIDAMPQSIRTSEVSGQRCKSRLPVSSTVSISAVGSSRFNPLGQEEGCTSALIPEDEARRRRWLGYGLGGVNDRDCPVIDDWLVDDMSSVDQPPAKRKKQQTSSSGATRKEVRSFLEGNSSNDTPSSRGGNKRKRPPLHRKSGASSHESLSSRNVASDSDRYGRDFDLQNSKKRRRGDVVEISSSDSDERFLDTVILTEEDLADSDAASTGGDRLSRASSLNTSGRSLDPPHSYRPQTTPSSRYSRERQPNTSLTTQSSSSSSHLANSRNTHHHQQRFNSSPFSHNHQVQATTSLGTSCTLNNNKNHNTLNPSTLPCSDVPPLRIRVKIESKSYLIPCPCRDLNGLDTTVQWLITEASERHYAQRGARPKLSLTTSDGAILSPSDPIAHVLSSNEEIVGVVEDWREATIEESYQAACKNSGVEPHLKALEYFRSHSSSTLLDLSELHLTGDNSTPLFRAIGGCGHHRSLSSLILKGNTLGDAAMTQLTSSLSQLAPPLSELNLSRTGITAQGVESLARFSPTHHPEASAVHSQSSSSPWSGLKTLNLSFNKLGVACGRGLAALLSQCKNLQELYLSSCRLGPGVFYEQAGVCESLKGLLDLIELNISLNPLGPEGVSTLFTALPMQLSRLNLRETCKKNRPITEAMTSSQCHCWLESLDLSHCGVNDRGLPTLVYWLGECSELKELKLAGSSISSSGVEPLCNFISSLSALRLLDISGAVHLGNAGSLKVLQACCGCGMFAHELDNEEDKGRVCLKGCGLMSPLLSDLVDLLKSVLKGQLGDSAVDMSGNKIAESDKQNLVVNSS